MALGTKAGNIYLDLNLNKKGFNTSLNGITKIAAKAGAAVAAAFSVTQIVRFGKECVDLGSDLEEVQNVVDVAFPTMSKQIDSFATSAAKSFGLSETMAKRFAGTFGSMSTAFGFAESQAAEMATTLTGLAGDVASFYNITQDEAYTKLKSVFTGETESLKDLGVVMTQTALDQYALAKGFGKTTKAMTEQEKVTLRYKFVQDQLANATGDFIRTSDSWANQVRVLSLQFDSLKASIGQGLINVLKPVVQWLNVILERLNTVAKSFAEFTSIFSKGSKTDSGVKQITTDLTASGVSADNLSSAAGTASDNLSSASKQAKELQRTLSGFDQINKLDAESGTSSAGNIGASGLSAVDTAIATTMANAETTTNAAAEKIAKKFKWIGQQIQDGWKSAFKADVEPLIDNCERIRTATKAIWDSSEVKTAKNQFLEQALETFASVHASAASVAVSFSVGITGGIADAKEGLIEFNKTKTTDIFNNLSDILKTAQGLNNAFSTIAKAAESEGFQKIVSVLYKLADITLLSSLDVLTGIASDLFKLAFKPFIDNADNIKDVFGVTLDIMGELFEPVSKLLDKISANSTSYKNSVVHQFFEQATSDRVKSLGDFLIALKDDLNELLDAMQSDRPVSESLDVIFGWILGKKPSDIKVSITTTFKAIKEKAFDTVKTAWDALKNSTVTKTIKGVKDKTFNTIKSAWDAIKSKTATLSLKFSIAAADLKKWINSNVIDKINSKFSKVPILKNVKIPHLAQGGYVKANTPQLALIGDNRHQGEVVAPENKLAELARKGAELAGAGGNDAEIIRLLKEILKYLMTINLTAVVNGDSVKQIIVKLINEHTRATGVCEIDI